MRRIEERKFSMYEVTYNFLLAADPLIINLMPLMSDYITYLGNNITSISEHGGTQKLNRKGIADDKSFLRDNLTIMAAEISRKIRGYAVNVENLVLVSEIKYTAATLDKLPDNVMVIVSNIIHEKASEHLPELNTYGIDADALDNFRDAIDNYYASIPKPRTGIVIRRGATLNLKQLFNNTDYLLKNQMDVLMGIVQNPHPNFYTSYINSRKIINPGSFPLSIRCQVVNEMNEPMAGVLAQAPQNNKEYRTKEKGKFYIKSFPTGTHQFVFSKQGYETKTVTVVIAYGERTDVKVTLAATAQTTNES
jgi:hypothetical protein